MKHVLELIKNPVFQAAFFAWIIAQVLKIVIELVTEKRLDFRRLIASGGMPSSHSALVTSVTAAVGFTSGFSSTLFIVCAAFAFIVMYDAAGVRRAAGEQARIINRLLAESDVESLETIRLHEYLGHTPLEVLAGAFLGVVIAIFTAA